MTPYEHLVEDEAEMDRRIMAQRQALGLDPVEMPLCCLDCGAHADLDGNGFYCPECRAADRVDSHIA